MDATSPQNKSHRDNKTASASELSTCSKARAFCRDFIASLIKDNMASTLTEVGVSDFTDYFLLRDMIKKSSSFKYIGTSTNKNKLEEANNKIPDATWTWLDITLNAIPNALKSDIVYANHVLEHAPSLEPGLSNMLKLTNHVCIHIFSTAPSLNKSLQVNAHTSSSHAGHRHCYCAYDIKSICHAHKFDGELITFYNSDLPGFGTGFHQKEVVLVAMRSEQDSKPLAFEYDEYPEL